MNQIIVYMLTWGGLLLFGAFLMNALAMGLPFKLLSVRASMGRKIIVQIRTMQGFYYKTGTIDGDFLIVRARGDKRSEKRRIDLASAEKLLGRPVLFRAWGVVNTTIDEATNGVLSIDLRGVQPHDAIKVDHLIKRALLAPKIQDKKELVIIILLFVVLLGVLYIGYKVGKIDTNTLLILARQNSTRLVEATIQ